MTRAGMTSARGTHVKSASAGRHTRRFFHVSTSLANPIDPIPPLKRVVGPDLAPAKKKSHGESGENSASLRLLAATCNSAIGQIAGSPACPLLAHL